MKRFCYFCRKPLGIEKRAEIFCDLRCQKLHAQLSHGPSGPERGPLGREQEHSQARRQGAERRTGRPHL